MAKKKADSPKKLMPPKDVTVKSRAYGVHIRAARGSQTPVAINDAFKENVAKTAVINNVAKRVHDLLKLCSSGFKESMLWQTMLSRMRKAGSDDIMTLLLGLKGMELNETYSLKRFMPLPKIRSEKNKKKLLVRLHGCMPLRKGKETQYRYELLLLLLGKEPADDSLLVSGSDWMDFENKEKEVVFEYLMPSKAQYLLLCLHFMGGKDGKAIDTLSSRGMQIVHAGEIAQTMKSL